MAKQPSYEAVEYIRACVERSIREAKEDGFEFPSSDGAFNTICAGSLYKVLPESHKRRVPTGFDDKGWPVFGWVYKSFWPDIPILPLFQWVREQSRHDGQHIISSLKSEELMLKVLYQNIYSTEQLRSFVALMILERA
jgi:hypothetical protein